MLYFDTRNLYLRTQLTGYYSINLGQIKNRICKSLSPALKLKHFQYNIPPPYQRVRNLRSKNVSFSMQDMS